MSPTHSNLRRSGFTLVELLIGLAVTSIVVTGILSAMIGTQKALEVDNDIREPMANLRNGMAYVERVTRLAGYGVDPRFAFDIQATALPGTTKDNYSTTEFLTDDLAFRYRDPAFLRRGTLSSGTLTLDPIGGATFGTALRENQPLMLICPTVQMDETDASNRNGEKSYYVVRVRNTGGVAANATTATVTAYGDPFLTFIPGCLAETGANAAFVTLMYDVRIRVMPIGTPPVPYLVAMYDFGNPTDNLSAGLYSPIAKNVRDFQVAYIMNRALPTSGVSAPDATSTGGSNDWILGNVVGDPIPGAGSPTPPNYDTDYDNAARFTTHPANIRAIRISVTVYSEANATASKRSSWYAAENSTLTSVATDRFFSTVGTAIAVPNVASRTFFVPFPSGDCNGQADCNRWGG